jgi:hypothetical protein
MIMTISRNYINFLIVTAGLALAASGGAFAMTDAGVPSSSASVANRGSAQEVTVTLNAGETYVISDVGADNTPAVHVVDNPHALIVRTDAAGQIVLLAAAAGQWVLKVKIAAAHHLRGDRQRHCASI